MRLKHKDPDVSILSIPGQDPVEADAGAGFTVTDEQAGQLLALPFWSVHTEPLIETDTGGATTRPAPARKPSRSRTAPPAVRAEASTGGATQG